MVHITSMEALLANWSEVAFSPDPWAALAEAGSVIAPELNAKLVSAGPTRVRPTQRAEFLAALQQAGVSLRNPHFRIGVASPFIRRELPAGEFDVVLSLRLEVVNQVLSGLYATHLWPRDVPPDEVGSLVTIEDLRDLSDDLPNVEGLAVGALHLTAEPTVEVGADPNRGLVRVAQPVQFDVDILQAGVHTPVTSLSGILRYDARPRASEVIDAGQTTIAIALDSLSVFGGGDFSVDADSPIQARDAEALARFSAKIVNIVEFFVVGIAGENSGITIAPEFRLPFDREVPVRLIAARTGTARTSFGLGALIVGARVAFSDDFEVPAGEIPDSVRISADPFGDSPINMVMSVHESTLQAAATASIPVLERKANDKIPGFSVVIESVEVELAEPNVARFQANAKIPDFCGPGPFNVFDLDFTVRVDIDMSVFDGTLRLHQGEGSVNLDNTDIALCVISGAADVLTLAWLDVLISLGSLIIGKVWLSVSDALGERNRDFNGVLNTGPVPFTELAPRAEILQAGVTNHRFELRGGVTLVDDTEHIFAYIKVHEQRPGGRTPLAGVQVRLRDRDAPRPLGDDFVPPQPEPPVVEHIGGVIKITERTIELPDRDENLGKPATTNDDGLARLVVARRRAGGRGATLVTKTATTFPQTGTTNVETTRTQLHEQRPDVYIRVTLPDGRRFDSLRPDGTGLILNLSANHIGSPEAPLDFVVSVD